MDAEEVEQGLRTNVSEKVGGFGVAGADLEAAEGRAVGHESGGRLVEMMEAERAEVGPDEGEEPGHVLGLGSDVRETELAKSGKWREARGRVVVRVDDLGRGEVDLCSGQR